MDGFEFLAAAQFAFHHDQQVFGVEGFDHIIVHAHRLPGAYIGPFAPGGQEDKRDSGPGDLGTHGFQEFVAIHAGHHDVGYDQVRQQLRVLHNSQPFLAVGCRQDLIILEFQDVTNALHQVKVIFDDEDSGFG